VEILSRLDTSCSIVGMVDSSFLVKAIEIVKRATEEDANQDYEEAFKLYQHALDYFVAAMKCE
jgi:vacuolar protein-sorting-associated protein 4